MPDSVYYATNTMYALLRPGQTPSLEELHQAAIAACMALEEVEREENETHFLLTALEHLDTRRREYRNEVAFFLRDARTFQAFEAFERDILKQTPFAPEVVNALAEQARDLRDAISTWNENPYQVVNSLRRLHHVTCYLARALQEYQRTIKHLQDTIWGVASIAVIGLNKAVESGQPGEPTIAALCGISGAFGSLLLSRAAAKAESSTRYSGQST